MQLPELKNQEKASRTFWRETNATPCIQRTDQSTNEVRQNHNQIQ